MTRQEFFGKFKSLFLWGNLAAMVLVLILLFFGMKWWLASYTHHGENIEVPDVTSKSLQEAEKILSAKGLQIKAVAESYNRELPAGCVIVQNPKAGASVKEGRIVYVTLNSLTVPKVTIPDVIGFKSYRGAQSDLLALDFELTDPETTVGPRDLVMKIRCDGRELSNGEQVAKYSRLTLVIGDGSGDVSGSAENLPELPEEVIIEEIEEEPVIEEEEYVPEVFE